MPAIVDPAFTPTRRFAPTSPVEGEVIVAGGNH
jgi:hypothetical protein